MWTKILGFILDKDNRTFLLIGALVLALMFGFTQCNRKQYFKAQEQKQINNIEALRDTVGEYKNKVGELTKEKLAFQSDVEQLKTLNEDLYNELQKEQDKVEVITKLNAELSSDTTEAETQLERLDIGAWRFNWSVERSGAGWNKVLEGFSYFEIDSVGMPFNGQTVVTKDQLFMQLITGVTSNNRQKRIFVRSTYPDVNFTQIQGAIIDDPVFERKNKRYGIGPSIGYGITPDGFKPYVGINLTYNLLRF